MPDPVSALRGVLVGDSQLKFLCRSRLRLLPLVSTCTFSFGGHDAVSLQGAIARTHFRRSDFAVLYVGGNDLASGADPREIASNIKVRILYKRRICRKFRLMKCYAITAIASFRSQDLVRQVQDRVASTVFVFKVLPRGYSDAGTANVYDHRRRTLNRRLVATLKRLPGVHILNPEVRDPMALSQLFRVLHIHHIVALITQIFSSFFSAPFPGCVTKAEAVLVRCGPLPRGEGSRHRPDVQDHRRGPRHCLRSRDRFGFEIESRGALRR